MRVLARIGYTLAGLALIAPAGARAGCRSRRGALVARPAEATAASRADVGQAGRRAERARLCADCLRTRVMAQKGVNIPPPPPLPPGTVVRKNMCTTCGRPAAVLAGRPAPSRRRAAGDDGRPLRAGPRGGRRRVGYAVSGNDPAPIGMVQPRLAAAGRDGRAGRAARPLGHADRLVSSPSDPLMPTAEKQPAHPHAPVRPLGHRPRAGRARERRNEEKHARIPYGAANAAPVQNVPASVVYGR